MKVFSYLVQLIQKDNLEEVDKNVNIYKFQQYIQMMQQQLLQFRKKQQQRSLFSTNQVLIQQDISRVVYYLPCYVRFKVRQILQVDIQKMQATVSGTLLFSFYYGKLNRKILKELIDKEKGRIRLQITAKQPLSLTQSDSISIKRDRDENIIHYRIKQEFTCILKSQVDYSPFQILNLNLTVIAQKITIEPEQEDKKDDNDAKSLRGDEKLRKKKIEVKFNCMDADDVDVVISSKNLNFKDYNIAKYFLQARYHNTDACLFQKLSVLNDSFAKTQYPIQTFNKINEYRYANFRIPLYKEPGASLIQIFVPLWILGFITLLIFFQQTSLSGRISIIATLTLAFIAFIPVINTQIPKTPNIKLVQILIYMQTFTTILCLIESLIMYMNQDCACVFVWNTDILFLTSMGINLANMLAVFVLFTIHKLFWQKKYLSSQNKGQTGDTINRQKWQNYECNQHFEKYFNDKKVRVL